MAKLRDIMGYLIKNYPRPNELAKGRLTKMVYLADWESAQEHGRQISDIQWFFNNHGPYVRDIFELAKKDSDFFVKSTENTFGTLMDIIGLRNSASFQDKLLPEELHILDSVIKSVSSLKNWSDFIRYVYDTHPVATQPRYTDLDLVALAREIKQRNRM